MTLLSEKWKTQAVADFEGLLCASGDAFTCSSAGLSRFTQTPVFDSVREDAWLHVGVWVERALFGGAYVVKCGEALEHGSIGVVVLESLQTQSLVWSFVSSRSNPFEQLEVKGSFVLAVSTLGSVFRFQPPLQSAQLFLHDLSG